MINTLFGVTFETAFELTGFSGSSYIAWGDGTYSQFNEKNTHIYETAGVYEIKISPPPYTDITTYTVCINPIIPTIEWTAKPEAPVPVNCPIDLELSITSPNATEVVRFYAANSNSGPYQQDRSFWSHLKPQWRFLYDGDIVEEMELTGTPLNDNLYSYTVSIQYIDNLPGEDITLFATLIREGENSQVAAFTDIDVINVVADTINITQDGIYDIPEIQWTDTSIPFVLSIGNDAEDCYDVLHAYESTSPISYRVSFECLLDQASTETIFITAQDIDCKKIGGYTFGTVTIPTSSFGDMRLVEKVDDCQIDSYYVLQGLTQLHARIVVEGVDVTDGTVNVTDLSGASNWFTVYRMEDFDPLVWRGSEFSLLDSVISSLPETHQNTPFANTYLPAVFGDAPDLQYMLGLITLFTETHKDIDTMDIRSIISAAKMMDVEIDDYGILFPREIHRLMHLASTNPFYIFGKELEKVRWNIVSTFEPVAPYELLILKAVNGPSYQFWNVPHGTTTLEDLQEHPFILEHGGLQNICFYRPSKNNQAYNSPTSLMNHTHTPGAYQYTNSKQWRRDIERKINYELTKNLIS
jgi:hypothetical protein